MPVAEKYAMKQKHKMRRTFSSSSDLRQRIHQKKEKKIKDSEVLTQNNKNGNTVTFNILIIYLIFNNCIWNFSLEAA